MADLLGEDFALVEKNALYRCLDKLLEHKQALFSHLRQRRQDLFAARFDVLLKRLGALIGPYDLFIAAQARRQGATLVTANFREFERVPGLAVADWAA